MAKAPSSSPVCTAGGHRLPYARLKELEISGQTRHRHGRGHMKSDGAKLLSKQYQPSGASFRRATQATGDPKRLAELTIKWLVSP